MTKSLSYFNLWRLLLFISSYYLLYYVYFLIPDPLYIDKVFYYSVGKQCAALIDFLRPNEKVIAYHNHILSSRADLEIVRGCDCAGVLFLLMAAILTFKANLKQKFYGLLLGFCFVYSLNIVRLISLYCLFANNNQPWFQFVHLYFAPSLMIIATLMFFVGWVIMSRQYVEKPA